MYLGWMLLHVLLERVLPGETAEGVLLPNQKRLSYRLSGHLQFWVTLAIVTHGCVHTGTVLYRGRRPLSAAAANRLCSACSRIRRRQHCRAQRGPSAPGVRSLLGVD